MRFSRYSIGVLSYLAGLQQCLNLLASAESCALTVHLFAVNNLNISAAYIHDIFILWQSFIQCQTYEWRSQEANVGLHKILL